MSSPVADRPTTVESPPPDVPVSDSVPMVRRLLGGVLGAVPPLIVFALLAAIGWWGHHTGWTLPSFAELRGETAPPTDWCEEHRVPESECVECNPELSPPPPDHGWCKEHGVHQCPLHHPELAQAKRTPEVTAVDLERARTALDLRPRPENNFACVNYRRRIQFASHAAVLEAGVDVELVERRPMSEFVTAPGEIRYDETRLARLSSKAAGTVWRVEKEVGDPVREGELLALVDAAEVGRLKGELLAAITDVELQRTIHDRLAGLAERQIVAGRQLDEAATELAQARTRGRVAEQALVNLGLPVDVEGLRSLSEDDRHRALQLLGLPKSMRSEFDPRTTTSNLLPLNAPMDGVIVERRVVAGEVVDSSDLLFEVANVDRMWLMLNVAIEDSEMVEPGLEVRFTPDGLRDEVRGRIDWVSTAVDRTTRTVPVRAVVPNPGGALRDETFGSGRIVLREEPEAIAVPHGAIAWDSCCHVVFVRDEGYFEDGAPKLFHIRSVRIGARDATHTEIIAGILPGEVVVTEGTDVLRSQLLVNNLGEGCTCGQ